MFKLYTCVAICLGLATVSEGFLWINGGSNVAAFERWSHRLWFGSGTGNRRQNTGTNKPEFANQLADVVNKR